MHVLIVGNHPVLHQTLSAVVLAAMPGTEVRTETNLNGALASAGRLQDALKLVLLDLGLPGCTGMEALTRFRDAFPQPRVVVVSATEDAASVDAAFQGGAEGYIPKTTAPGLMVEALKLVASGGTCLPPRFMQDAPRAMRVWKSDDLDLTGRQAEVLSELMKGLSYQDVARELGISENTVRQHAHAAYKMLGVASRTEALIALARKGLKIG